MLRRLRAHHLRVDAAPGQRIADVVGVLDRHGEHQPALAVARQVHDLVAGGFHQVGSVGDLGQLADHVVVARGAHVARVNARHRRGRHQRCEEAQVQQLAHLHPRGHVGEQRLVAGGQPDAVAAEGRAGPADRARMRAGAGQVAEELPPHARLFRVDEVTLVGQHDVDAAQVVGLLVDAADRGVGDLPVELLLADGCAVQAHVGLRPDLQDLVDVLLQQLLLVDQHQDAGAGELSVRTLRQGRDHQALASADRGLDDRVAAVVPAKPVPQLVERALLIGAQLHATTFAVVMPCACRSPLSAARSASITFCWQALISLDDKAPGNSPLVNVPCSCSYTTSPLT